MIGFWEVDLDDESLSDEVREVAEFLTKMDYEGGIDGLFGYGGADYFPESCREAARLYGEAEENLRQSIKTWANERGVDL